MNCKHLLASSNGFGELHFCFNCPASDMALAWYLYQKQTTISGHGFPQIKILLSELRIKATLVGTTTFLTAEKRFSLHR